MLQRGTGGAKPHPCMIKPLNGSLIRLSLEGDDKNAIRAALSRATPDRLRRASRTSLTDAWISRLLLGRKL